MRVVLDTKVLVSGVAYPGSVPGRIVGAWRSGALEVVLSEYILSELRRVLPRLQARHGLSATIGWTAWPLRPIWSGPMPRRNRC